VTRDRSSRPVLRAAAGLTVAVLLAGPAAFAQTAPAENPCAEGRQLFVENNYLAAEPLLRQCLEQGDSLLALLPLTMMTVIQGRPQEGVEFGRRALALAPDDANVRYWYRRALAQSGQIEPALEQWEQALALDSGHVGVLEGLARLSIQRGETAKAYNLLNQLQLQGVDDAWLHRMLSGLARRKGLWDRAASHWRAVVEREGATEQNVVVLGELHILAGRAEEAVDIFRQAVRDAPSAATWGGLGEAWFALEEVDSAAVALRRAVELDPDNARSRFNLANALELLGDADGAGEQFRTYLQSKPDDPVARFNYGVHLEHRGDVEGAIEQIEQAVALDATYVQAHVVLAQLYENAGRIDDALPLLDRLGELDPDARPELAEWRGRMVAMRDEAVAERAAGKVHLLHVVTADPAAVEPLRAALAAGEDFAGIASRFSEGPTAVRGGDIGWVDPTQMRPELREAIEPLEPGQTSDLITVDERTHVFKRVR
jgi:tetratricopeptide (TPR) repeat protein